MPDVGAGPRAWTRGDLLWWASVWGAVTLAGAGLHTAAFHLHRGPWSFSGFLLNSSDPWGYLGFSRRFAEGGLLIDNPFAPTAASPAFFNLLWLLVGKAQAFLGLGFLPVYYALGIAASGCLYAALLVFTREFLGDGPKARLAYLLAGLGTGFGWIPALASERLAARMQSFDLYHHEGFPVLSALFFPHVALSTALLVTILLWFHRGVATGRRGWVGGSAALLLVLSFIQPYHLVTVLGVAAAWVAAEQAAARGRPFRGWIDLAALAVAALPPLLYYRWLFHQPNWAVWETSNVVRSTARGFLIGVGPLLLLAAIGAWRGRGDLGRKRILLAWAAVGTGLVFSHPLFAFEAKFVQGLTVPLAVLGAGAIFDGELRLRGRQWALAALVIAPLLPSVPYLALKSLEAVGGRGMLFPKSWTPGAYLYHGDRAVMRFLAERPLDIGLIMVPPEEGRLLPAAAGVRVYVSTPSLTPDFAQRSLVAERVYAASTTSGERRSLLRAAGATHLWWSPVWGLGFNPARESYLEPVFVDRGAGVWRIVP